MEQNLESKATFFNGLQKLLLIARGIEGFRCRSPPKFISPTYVKGICDLLISWESINIRM